MLNLGIVGSAADYVHRAGRIGRVGQTSRGQVISVLQPAEVADLLSLGSALHFSPTERPPPEPVPFAEGMGQEDAVQSLSDIFHLYE